MQGWIWASVMRAGVDLFIHQQGIDTSTPAGKLFFSIVGAFGQFERELIRSRVMAGLERARAKASLGRQPGSPKVEEAIRKQLKAGVGMLKIARTLSIGTNVVQRVSAERRAGGRQTGSPGPLGRAVMG